MHFISEKLPHHQAYFDGLEIFIPMRVLPGVVPIWSGCICAAYKLFNIHVFLQAPSVLLIFRKRDTGSYNE